MNSLCFTFVTKETIYVNFCFYKIIYFIPKFRAGKISFSGERNSVLLKASSEARCAPRNFVLIVTLRGTSVCLTMYLTVHQMK